MRNKSVNKESKSKSKSQSKPVKARADSERNRKRCDAIRCQGVVLCSSTYVRFCVIRVPISISGELLRAEVERNRRR